MGHGAVIGGDAWIRPFFAVVLTAVLMYYLATVTRHRFLTHAPHQLAAVGMVYMFFPPALQVVPIAAWLAVFGAASAGCVSYVGLHWRRHGILDLDFAHSELAECTAMVVMLPLATLVGEGISLPLSIVLGTYFLGYAIVWAVSACGRPVPLVISGRQCMIDGRARSTRSRGQAMAQATMGLGMAFMFLVM